MEFLVFTLAVGLIIALVCVLSGRSTPGQGVVPSPSPSPPGPDDLVLGVVDSTTPSDRPPHLILSRADQEHHATVWGRTGSGKSKLLQSLFLQHLDKGHGIGLIDPHHDLAFD